MKENIELSQNRDFGDILTDAFVVIKQNFKSLLKAYFSICGLFLLTSILISVQIGINRGEPSMYTLLGFVGIIFSFVNYAALILTVQSYLAVYKQKGNQPPQVIEVWGYFKYYFFRVFFTQFLLFIAICIGFMFCFFPGVYLSVVFSLVIPIMVIENGDLEYSIKKAFKIIKGNWWFTFGIILLFSLVIGVATLVLMLPGLVIYGSAQFLTGKNLDTSSSIIQSVIMSFSQVFIFVLISAVTLVYYTLTEEKEGNSLIDRINMFGKSTPGADQASSEQY
jgi:hypothetical protein